MFTKGHKGRTHKHTHLIGPAYIRGHPGDIRGREWVTGRRRPRERGRNNAFDPPDRRNGVLTLATKQFEADYAKYLKNGKITEFYSDNEEGNFASKEMSEFFQVVGTRQSFAIPYEPNTNPVAERANQEAEDDDEPHVTRARAPAVGHGRKRARSAGLPTRRVAQRPSP